MEVIESNQLSFSSSGLTIPGSAEDNLCLKAYYLLKSAYDLPPVAIHLHKNIPIGAGLGGGSSDGAFMIKLLNEKFSLGITLDKQEKLAAQLGSDCPFFIRNVPIFVEGTGNVFSDINISLKRKYLVLVIPKIHVSTKYAYAGVIPHSPNSNLRDELEKREVSNYQGSVKNNFEASVFKQHPELEQLKLELIEQGALYASMSGSGSSIYGIFKEEPKFELSIEFQVFKLSE